MIEAGLRPQNVEFWSGKDMYAKLFNFMVFFGNFFLIKKTYIIFIVR
jgi:hypothetical protein